MFPTINPTNTTSWKELTRESKENILISKCLKEETDRLNKLSFNFQELFFDFSKNKIKLATINPLIKLANECFLSEAIEALFRGEKINKTENRAVLHPLLRSFTKNHPYSKGIATELERIKDFTESIHNGKIIGYSGKKITDIVNIGIGGSDLGTKTVCYALEHHWKGVKPHFISNIDPANTDAILKVLNPETTLFIIASKTFTTLETMSNAMLTREWLLASVDKSFLEKTVLEKHFIGISSNIEKMNAFGISKGNQFVFWEWVGGRYSIWSTIGLIISVCIGYQGFEQFLRGANAMDIHFQNTPLENNIPVLAGMIGVWYNNFLECDSYACIPYSYNLRLLPAHLQQVDMESNGKSVDRGFEKINYQSGPIIWGGEGTNCQHAFFQLLHQGTKIIPADFIAIANHSKKESHHKLIANFIGQSKALAFGKSKEELAKELDPKDKAFNYRTFEGNKPSTTILLKELSPYNLGTLIAFYEHKIFTQGVIWNIFSFDQWGVELGKQQSMDVFEQIAKEEINVEEDTSTATLLKKYLQMRK